jgi:5'-methylthioadenosine phosphorylase
MIGVFGGTGFYQLVAGAREVEVDTPYGPPSDKFLVGEIEGVEVAFLPRHRRDHSIPPHQINYRANLWGMKELGVERIIGPSAAGSLAVEMEPGHLVVPDQVVDRTWGRASTFYDGPKTVHVSYADPYCAELRPLAVESCRRAGATVHDGGTTVVIQGPRFSTRAESRWFADAGFQVINMTQLPESYLAREQEICYVNVSVITDYDVGVAEGDRPVTHHQVMELFEQTLGTLKQALTEFIPRAAGTPRLCECAHALSGAVG